MRAVLTALAARPRVVVPIKLPPKPAVWVEAVAPTTGRLHILLAEDNAVNRLVAVRLLQKQGHSVTVVCDGRQAVDTLAREQFDLALLDIQMPELDGYEVAAAGFAQKVEKL